MKNVIDIYKNAIIQIATPWGTGTGFYLKSNDLIVTNRHVVDGSKEVIISGRNFKKRTTEVLYMDPVYDIAFLNAPNDLDFPEIELAQNPEVIEGQTIIAIGHPYGLRFSASQGIISKARRQWKNMNYIQIDAAINPGNSGGPLIDENNKIIGVNTFLIADGQNLGFALPVQYLKESLIDYEPQIGKFAVRCASCSNIVTEETVQHEYCPHCGVKIGKEAFEGKKYVPSTTGKKIEEIIAKLDYDIKLARVGQNFWEIEEGSANIKINYNPETRYMVAYSTLCRLPKKNISTIYEFLLKENNNLPRLSFSVINQDIVLSSIYIFDEDLHIETELKLFKKIFKKADDYDDVLIDMGAIPIDEETD